MSTKPKRYVHGLWSHIFETNGADLTVKLCYDTRQEKLIALQVEQGDFRPATRDEFSDVEDSLKTANDDALTNPLAYGLASSDHLPLWAGPGRKRVIAVIDFEDSESDIEDLSGAATWLELALGKQANVTTYAALSEAVDAIAAEG